MRSIERSLVDWANAWRARAASSTSSPKIASRRRSTGSFSGSSTALSKRRLRVVRSPATYARSTAIRSATSRLVTRSSSVSSRGMTGGGGGRSSIPSRIAAKTESVSNA